MNLIEVRNLCKQYKGSNFSLKEVTFSVKNNEIFGYIGPNGSGKTTTIRILCGLLEKDAGEFHLFADKDTTYNKGIVLEQMGLYKRLTAWENLEFSARLAGFSKKDISMIIEKLLTQIHLIEHKDRIVKQFSKGMARKLTIIKAVIHNPNILILDEPFDGIDTKTHYELIQFLKQWVKSANRCILMTSHNMSDVELLCDRIAIINNGEIIEDNSISRIKSNQPLNEIEIVFREDVTAIQLQHVLKKYGKVIAIQDNVARIEIPINQTIESITYEVLKAELAFTEIKQVNNSLEQIYLRKVEN